MYRIYETEHYNDYIINLWHDVFGDTEDEIRFFIENCVNKSCLCFECDGVLASQLFLVDCKVGNEEYKYIYAACTAKAYRKRGFMTDLLEYTLRSYYNVTLIPANSHLVDHYNNAGFKFKMKLADIHFDENEEICEYLFDGCSLEEPFALSNVNQD